MIILWGTLAHQVQLEHIHQMRLRNNWELFRTMVTSSTIETYLLDTISIVVVIRLVRTSITSGTLRMYACSYFLTKCDLIIDVLRQPGTMVTSGTDRTWFKSIKTIWQKKSYEYIIKNTGTSSTTRTMVTFRTIIIYELLIISSTSDVY